MNEPKHPGSTFKFWKALIALFLLGLFLWWFLALYLRHR
jgi:hypothetical protein